RFLLVGKLEVRERQHRRVVAAAGGRGQAGGEALVIEGRRARALSGIDDQELLAIERVLHVPEARAADEPMRVDLTVERQSLDLVGQELLRARVIFAPALREGVDRR